VEELVDMGAEETQREHLSGHLHHKDITTATLIKAAVAAEMVDREVQV
jgi:hypothetical protein